MSRGRRINKMYSIYSFAFRYSNMVWWEKKQQQFDDFPSCKPPFSLGVCHRDVWFADGFIASKQSAGSFYMISTHQSTKNFARANTQPQHTVASTTNYSINFHGSTATWRQLKMRPLQICSPWWTEDVGSLPCQSASQTLEKQLQRKCHGFCVPLWTWLPGNQ